MHEFARVRSLAEAQPLEAESDRLEAQVVIARCEAVRSPEHAARALHGILSRFTA
jgi:hypothetical protein